MQGDAQVAGEDYCFRFVAARDDVLGKLSDSIFQGHGWSSGECHLERTL